MTRTRPERATLPDYALIAHRLLGHPSPEVRATAARAIASSAADANEPTLDALRRARTDPDAVVRTAAEAALNAIQRTASGRVVDVLVSSLEEDPDLAPERARRLLDMMRRHRDPRARIAAISAIRSSLRRVASLVTLSPEFRAELDSMSVYDSSRAVRHAARRALPRAEASELVERLSWRDRTDRAEAVTDLLLLGSEARPALEQAVLSTNASISIMAARIIERLNQADGR